MHKKHEQGTRYTCFAMKLYTWKNKKRLPYSSYRQIPSKFQGNKGNDKLGTYEKRPLKWPQKRLNNTKQALRTHLWHIFQSTKQQCMRNDLIHHIRDDFRSFDNVDRLNEHTHKVTVRTKLPNRKETLILWTGIYMKSQGNPLLTS